MKVVGITLRVAEDTRERRDSLDQRWYPFLRACGLTPLLLPNDELALELVRNNVLQGIIFSGGNTLFSLGGTAPERDSLEEKLIKYCIQKKIPLMGVCRGMQVIQNFFHVPLRRLENHSGVRHEIYNSQNERKMVNSFHDYGTNETVQELEVLYRACDEVVESIRHRDLPFLGIMWHPERELAFSDDDIFLVRRHFLCL